MMSDTIQPTSNILYAPTFWCAPADWYAIWKVSKRPLYIEAHETYQKRSWRNRMKIATAQGPQLLSIPLEQGKTKRAIRDVRISYQENWQRDHLNALRTNYQSAPFYEHYEEKIAAFYEKKYEFLWDWNQEWTRWLRGELEIQAPLEKTSEFVKPMVEQGALEHPQIFHQLGLKRSDHVAYPGVFETQLSPGSGLSVIDLLFCTGKEAPLYLNQWLGAPAIQKEGSRTPWPRLSYKRGD